MSCTHDCDRPDFFPAVLENRPGLARFRYRIGTYPSMRAHMLDRLVKSPALADWSHLAPDDPGIALLEGAALIGDILTFYQDLYGNETKLGTATWQDSITDLCRLTGYRPAPGLGGNAVFALEVDQPGPVNVPEGFPIEAQLEGFDNPSRFETTTDANAYQAFNSFHLYRRRTGLQPITAGQKSLDIVRRDGQTDLATRSEAVDQIAAGDRILILSERLAAHEILVVDRVEEHLDRVTVHLDGAVQQNHPAEISAYVLGRTFRHAGANAQATFTTFQESPPAVTVYDTIFDRSLSGVSPGSSRYSRLTAQEIALDSEVDDLATGANVICTGLQTSPNSQNFAVVRRIKQITAREVIWANVSTSVSVLTLAGSLDPTPAEFIVADLAGIELALQASAQPVQTSQSVAVVQQVAPAIAQSFQIAQPETGVLEFDVFALNAAQIQVFDGIGELIAPASGDQHDIRRLRIHETVGPELKLQAPRSQQNGPVSDGRVSFFGTREEAYALAGRRLLFSDDETGSQEIIVAAAQPELDALGSSPLGDRRMWPIMLSDLPKAAASGFDEDAPTVTIHGNLVNATQGETQDEIVIGTGDARTTFQTFALPKAPLTYLAAPELTPPQKAELEIRVAGRLWTAVDTFFDRPADAEIYVIRQGEDGNSYVQFADGINGARLPSGRNNVRARYRTGLGARGDLAADSGPKAKGKLAALVGVQMPGPVTGGADPEGPDVSRIAAPLRMQGLGRLVGLSDYEAEALRQPGVLKAGADFGESGTGSIRLTVLTQDESPESIAAVTAAMRHANRCRGPDRHSIEVIAGTRALTSLALQIGFDPIYRREDVLTAVTASLGALRDMTDSVESGLFSIADRRFAQDAHISQAVAAAQQVEGVVWVKPAAFERIGAGGDPTDLTSPLIPTLNARLPAAATEILVLLERNLTLDAVAVTTDKECVG